MQIMSRGNEGSGEQQRERKGEAERNGEGVTERTEKRRYCEGFDEEGGGARREKRVGGVRAGRRAGVRSMRMCEEGS